MFTVVALVATGCGEPEERAGSATAPEAPERAPGPRSGEPLAAGSADWAGSGVCAECHEEVSERWRGSLHHLVMREAGPEAVLGDFTDAAFRTGAVTWTFSEQSGRPRARSAGGEEGEYEIAYAITTAALQQYVVALPDGRLQVLPVGWDARPGKDGGGRWISLLGDQRIAADDPAHWKSPAVAWNATLADYHTTGFRKGFDLAANRYDSRWAEAGVGCEACHGPASRHIAWARAGGGGEAGDRGLPVRLEPRSRWRFADAQAVVARPEAAPVGGGELDVCAPCHSQRARIVDAPQPGARFLDGYEPVLLERGVYHDDGQPEQFAFEWGSFVQSREYAAGVRCSDCHDPHSAALRAEGNALCGGCHAAAKFDSPAHHHHEAGSRGASCVACHMPEQSVLAMEPHHDHSFRVPRPDLAQEIGAPDACAQCHAKRGRAWAAAQVTAWRGGAAPRSHFAERLHARGSAGSRAGEELASLVDDEAAPAIARATALVELASAPHRERIARAARSDDPLLRLAAARAAIALEPRDRVLGIGWLLEDPVRSVRIEAANALADVPDDALSREKRAARPRALEEFRAAQLASADQPGAHLILGSLHQRRGDTRAAEESYLTALRLADWFVPAYTNLAALYAEERRPGDAAALLHRGLEKMPDSPDLHFALGVLLAGQEETEKALEEMKAAVRLAPEIAHYAYVHGIALHSAGRPEEALATLQRALERNPHDQNLLGAVATMARDAGRYTEALRAAEQLRDLFPDQPEAIALVEDIESRRDGAAPAPPPESQ